MPVLLTSVKLGKVSLEQHFNKPQDGKTLSCMSRICGRSGSRMWACQGYVGVLVHECGQDRIKDDPTTTSPCNNDILLRRENVRLQSELESAKSAIKQLERKGN